MKAHEIEWRTIADTGLDIALTDTGDGQVFERFFEGYDRAFVLPNEKEDADGFRACLALNHGAEKARLEREYGRFVELCLIARDSGDKSFVGGANFIAMEVAGDDGPLVSANLNYIYVDAARRGKGYFGRLVRAVREAIRASLDWSGETLIFIEQNDPLHMSPEDYARDTAFTGLDQLDRMRIWAKQGAKVVDHPYVQPPLTPEAEPDDNLVYGVVSDRSDISACTLRDHLRKFFGISVLKGEGVTKSREAREQLSALDAMCAKGERIALLDATPFLGATAGRGNIEKLRLEGSSCAREAIRGKGAG